MSGNATITSLFLSCFKIDIYQLKLMCLGISQLNGFTLFGIGIEARDQDENPTI